MRTVDELTDTPYPAWPGLEAELRENTQVTVLPIDPAAGREALHGIQVTARSRMGAMALHTGGLLVDDGWLRVLGGGDARGLPSIGAANGLPGDETPPAALLIGYDVLGGRFELNGADPGAAGRPGAPGEVCYFGPDSLSWTGLEGGYSDWLSWIAEDGTTDFYETMRWPSWREETRVLPLTHGITVYPFLWSQQAQADLAATTRGPAPMPELFAIQDRFAAQL